MHQPYIHENNKFWDGFSKNINEIDWIEDMRISWYYLFIENIFEEKTQLHFVALDLLLYSLRGKQRNQD